MIQEPLPSDFLPISTDIDDLIKVMHYDHSQFILLFLYDQDQIELGVPDFHKWIMSLMNSSAYNRVCIAIPRDHAKTTIAKITAVHHFIYTRARFLAYVSNTNKVAAQSVKDIADFIRSPLCEQIYGKAVFTKTEDAKGNYDLYWRGKNIIMRAFGAGQQIRGTNVNNQRPDLAIVDDLESAEEGEKSKLGYSKLKKWFYGTFMKSMDKRWNKIIQIGNLVSNKSILQDHLKSATWKSVCLGVITQDGKPLWPQRWTIEALRLSLIEDMDQGQLHVWLAEMMNMPATEASALLDNGNIRLGEVLQPTSPEILMRCITVDPAISENITYADNAAITVHGFHSDGYWVPLEKDSLMGANPYKLYNRIMELAVKWRVRVIGIEAVAYQKALIHIAEHENARNGYVGFQFVELLSGKMSKTARIMLWVGMLNEGSYRLTMNDMDLIEEITNYDIESKNNSDDGIDSAAYIVYMIKHYLVQIAAIVSPVEKPNPQSTVHH